MLPHACRIVRQKCRQNALPVAELIKPLLQITRREAVGQTREIDVAAAANGIASVIEPFVVMRIVELPLADTFGPAGRRGLIAAMNDFVGGNLVFFQPRRQHQRFGGRAGRIVAFQRLVFPDFTGAVKDPIVIVGAADGIQVKEGR